MVSRIDTQHENVRLDGVFNEKCNFGVSLLTGGADRPYVFGLGAALMARVAHLDLVGSDDLDLPQFRGQPNLTFLNLRGSHRSDVNALKKATRILKYYLKLIRYAARARTQIFHILWNNKFETFDRTLLTLYYRCLGKKLVLTVHNVNAGIRDSKDSVLNRLTLRIQYRLADLLFVHTEKMKRELIEQFGVQETKIAVIPFGINNSIPCTKLTPSEAKSMLGLQDSLKIVLFFGNITPYKGLEYLVTAFQSVISRNSEYRLIIAGRPDNCEEYWVSIRQAIDKNLTCGSIVVRAEQIPDELAEIYFKAADVLVLPYRHVYQSGVLFTGYNFGLPALAADVGSLKEEVVDGKTGLVFKAEDAVDLARAIEQYFASDLYANLNIRRSEICEYALIRHSWDVIGQMTIDAYLSLPRFPFFGKSPNQDASSTSLDVKASS